MNEFKRKQWTRIALSVIAVAVAALFLTGIIGGRNMTYRIGENASAVTASEQGFGGEVTVQMELNGDNTVKSLAIDTPDETDGLGKRASEAEFTDQFIGKTGPFTFGEDGIEALSGATVTSNAALKAINRLLTGEEPAAEQPAEETQPAGEDKTTEETAEAGNEAGTAEAAPGSYVSEKETNFSTIRVEIQGNNGEITDCTITSEAKSEGSDFLTDEIRTAWAKAIVENQTADTDAITGATLTFSAGAVKEAVEEIRGQMAGGAAETPAEEQPAEAPAETGEDSGSYVSEKETNFSTIRVEIQGNNGEITDCTITSEAKSEGSDFLTDEIRTAWAKAIVENQTADTDAITGATLTFSAGAVKEAVEEIRGQMAGGAVETPAEEQPAEEKPAEGQPAEEQPAEPPAKTEESTGAAEQVYGSYLSEKETSFSKIRVTVSTKNDAITDCTITSEAKSEGSDFLTDEIRSAWAKAIVENQTADTDAITGATLTFSAGAVKEAVEEIRGQMTNSGAAETPAEEQPAEAPAEEQPAEEKPAAEQPAEEQPAENPAEEQPAGEQAAEVPAKPETKAASSGVVYGSYLSEKETDFSTIRVIVSTKDKEITGCRITSEAKSEGSDFLTDEIRTEWAKAVVENQGAEADAITGATLRFSAGAVKEAVGEIQQLIAGTPAAAEEPAAEEPAEEVEPEAAAAQPAEEPAAAEEAPAPAPYGGYLAVKETAFSTIRVIVSTRNGVITDCKVLCDAKEGQTDLVTDENEDAWEKAVVAGQGAEIDTVTGATVSSDAVREAVEEILRTIGTR